MRTQAKSDSFWAWCLLGPCLLGLLIFTYIPIFSSLGLSFSYWNLLGTPHFVGLDNYRDILTNPLFWNAFGNTVFYVIAVGVLEIVLGLALAVLLNQKIRGKALFRTAYFLPFITPLVSVALVWGWIYDPQYGILNAALELVGALSVFTGGEPIAWLYDERTALWAIVILQVWKNIGYTLVIFLAGLQGVPSHLYESAELEGATGWRSFWHITLPLITPTLFFVVLITVINSFQTFDSIYLLTEGGPNHSTDVLVYWMFKNAFEFYKIGPASAIAYVLFIVILALTLVQWQLRKRWVLYE